MQSVPALIDDVFHSLDTGRKFTAGDDVSVLDHSLQTAELLRRAFPTDIALQVAGLVHDIDHVIGHHPSVHGAVSATYLADVVNDDVVALVALHVPAKRFLVATDMKYRERLSAASELSLRAQGGPMSGDELMAFRSNRNARRAIALRRADDRAKAPGIPVPSLDSWRWALDAVASRRVRSRTRVS